MIMAGKFQLASIAAGLLLTLLQSVNSQSADRGITFNTPDAHGLRVKGYVAGTTEMSYTDAKAWCDENGGGQLVQFETTEEHTTVQDWLNDIPALTGAHYWLALEAVAVQSFKWFPADAFSVDLPTHSLWETGYPTDVATDDRAQLVDGKFVNVATLVENARPLCEQVEPFSENQDPCLSHMCQNGAQCLNKVDDVGYTCQCPQDYDGTFCEIPTGACYNHLCKNGAVCIPNGNGYVCDCHHGFTGTFCNDIAAPPRTTTHPPPSGCALNNGGCEYTCVPTVNSYHCACPAGLNLATNGRSCVGSVQMEFIVEILPTMPSSFSNPASADAVNFYAALTEMIKSTWSPYGMTGVSVNTVYSASSEVMLTLSFDSYLSTADIAYFASSFASSIGNRIVSHNSVPYQVSPNPLLLFVDPETGGQTTVEILDTCSVYDVTGYCLGGSECGTDDYGALCICKEGMKGERCDESEPVDMGNGLALDTVYIIIIAVVAAVVLIVVIVIIVCCCCVYTEPQPKKEPLQQMQQVQPMQMQTAPALAPAVPATVYTYTSPMSTYGTQSVYGTGTTPAITFLN